ncbi:hypothetical protein EDEG_03606 [Edhazardia aedis USNM 41457]|uniref:Uncharacterized protein n=1 Tax=Edhazardia aedis (strain USNM 41457) TaxID=1003232 RepID=J9D2X2_EDHAE|nr:hypothetical protein EDEG_03606 [Edhazardia aedis USNM 41457]|eukprot:EJW01924.1 hypothetical protein EDEG_03606 [Edhazardia aedis USNM 41457]
MKKFVLCTLFDCVYNTMNKTKKIMRHFIEHETEGSDSSSEGKLVICTDSEEISTKLNSENDRKEAVCSNFPYGDAYSYFDGQTQYNSLHYGYNQQKKQSESYEIQKDNLSFSNPDFSQNMHSTSEISAQEQNSFNFHHTNQVNYETCENRQIPMHSTYQPQNKKCVIPPISQIQKKNPNSANNCIGSVASNSLFNLEEQIQKFIRNQPEKFYAVPVESCYNNVMMTNSNQNTCIYQKSYTEYDRPSHTYNEQEFIDTSNYANSAQKYEPRMHLYQNCAYSNMQNIRSLNNVPDNTFDFHHQTSYFDDKTNIVNFDLSKKSQNRSMTQPYNSQNKMTHEILGYYEHRSSENNHYSGNTEYNHIFDQTFSSYSNIANTEQNNLFDMNYNSETKRLSAQSPLLFVSESFNQHSKKNHVGFSEYSQNYSSFTANNLKESNIDAHTLENKCLAFPLQNTFVQGRHTSYLHSDCSKKQDLQINRNDASNTSCPFLNTNRFMNNY